MSRATRSNERAAPEAERMLAERNKKDQMVTAEQAEQLSRPVQPGALSVRKPPSLSPGDPPALEAQGGVTTGAPEIFREVIGPDGSRKRVRVVAPTL